LVIDNSLNKELKPGMSAKVKIMLPVANANSVVVPVESVFYKEGKTYVWVFNESSSTVECKAVKVNMLETEGLMSVLSGLKGQEYVVTAGVYSLTNQQSVKILNNKL